MLLPLVHCQAYMNGEMESTVNREIFSIEIHNKIKERKQLGVRFQCRRMVKLLAPPCQELKRPVRPLAYLYAWKSQMLLDHFSHLHICTLVCAYPDGKR